MTTPPRGPNVSRPGTAAESSPSRAGLYAAILVVLALGAAGAWWFLFGGRTTISGSGASGDGGPRPEGGKPYLPATHVDGSRSKLSANADGNARVELVLRDVGDTAGLAAKLRMGADPKSPTLFIDTKTDETGIGLLGIKFSETGSPGESALAIDLGIPATHVRVIDLRFGGRWEGLELDASAPAPK
jgi:hypothetical protein